MDKCTIAILVAGVRSRVGPGDRTRNLGDCTKAVPLAPPPATPRPCLNGRARSLHVGLLQLLMRILLLPALRSCFSTPPSYIPRAAATDTAMITTTSNDVNVYRALVGCLLASCRILAASSTPYQHRMTSHTKTVR